MRNRAYLAVSYILLINVLLISSTLLIVLSRNPYSSTEMKNNIGNLPQRSSFSDDLIYITGNAELESFCTIGNGSSQSPFVIQGKRIDDTLDDGIFIRHTNAHLLIQNNLIANFEGDERSNCGIELFNCSNVILINNSIHSSNVGIKLEDSKNCKIFNNSVRDGNLGIYLLFTSTSNKISKNLVSGNKDYGFFLVGANNNTVIGNTAINNGKDGIYLDVADDNEIVNNIITSNGEAGIFMFDSNDNIIQKNVITQNKGYGIHFFDLSTNTISSNTLIGNEKGCLYKKKGEFPYELCINFCDCTMLMIIIMGIISVIGIIIIRKCVLWLKDEHNKK